MAERGTEALGKLQSDKEKREERELERQKHRQGDRGKVPERVQFCYFHANHQ